MAKTTRRAMASAIVLGLAVLPWLPAQGATPKTKRVNVRSNGAQALGGNSGNPSTSANGRFVAFDSSATNLVGGDTNALDDIFVHDRKTKKTKRVSVRSNGNQANHWSFDPWISANGRFVAFDSSATNLVSGDTNGDNDIFVHDRRTKKTKRVSVRSNGTQANDDSALPSISANGRFVAWESPATNLVPGDTNISTSGGDDIFVHDRKTGKTKRVSVRSNGNQGNGRSFNPSTSANGRFVAFESEATNLVGGDTEGHTDIFVHDRKTKKTKRVSVRSNGNEANASSLDASISADGHLVAFQSQATNLVPGDTNGHTDVFVHNRKSQKTKRVNVRSNGNQANDYSYGPSTSASGRFIAFGSNATNLVGNDTNGNEDVFMHDRKTGKTKRVSVRSNGGQANAGSHAPSTSGDGRFVAFASHATLVPDDNNGNEDILVRGPLR